MVNTFDSQIEAAETVAGQRIGSALKNDGIRLEGFHNFCDYGYEYRLVTVVVHAVAKGNVHSIVFPFAGADIL